MVQMDVGASEDFSEGGKTVLDVGGQRILFSRYNGHLYAVQGKCPHQGVDFAISGKVTGNVLHCRMHGANFDLTNGDLLANASAKDLRTYVVEEKAGRVFVDL